MNSKLAALIGILKGPIFSEQTHFHTETKATTCHFTFLQDTGETSSYFRDLLLFCLNPINKLLSEGQINVYNER